VNATELWSSRSVRYLAFRGWLRPNDVDRRVYEATKRELAEHFWPTMQDYADAKTDIIEAILARSTG